MKTKFKLLSVFALASMAYVANAMGIDPDTLASIGMAGMAIGNLEVIGLVKGIQDAFVTFKEKSNLEATELKKEIERIESKQNLRGLLGGPGGYASGGEIKQLVGTDGKQLPWLASGQKFTDFYRAEKSEFNIGAFCRDAVVGSTKATSTTALVPVSVSSNIIDMVRAATVIHEAGAGTIVITGPTNLAKLSSGPTVFQHTENTEDIDVSDVFAVPVMMNPKTLAVLVPLSLELVQDSPNLDALLNVALASAFAAKLDALCLATLLADSDIPASLMTEDPALWAKLLGAVSSAMVLNQRLPTCHISAPADFIARAGQVSSTGEWIGKPPALAGMAELQTTGLTAGTAFFGNFAEAFAIAMRSDLRVEIVRHQGPRSGTHLLVAHMRADGIVLQPGKLYKQLKTIA